MISLIMPVVFFSILVLIYPVASMMLSVSGWILKQWYGKRNIKRNTIGEMIDKKTDDLKDVMFKILAFLLFFFVSPFMAFYMLGVIH